MIKIDLIIIIIIIILIKEENYNNENIKEDNFDYERANLKDAFPDWNPDECSFDDYLEANWY